MLVELGFILRRLAAMAEQDQQGCVLAYLAEPDVFDDGPVKAGPDLEPHRAAADPRRRQLERRHPDARLDGGSERPALRLLVNHDDAEREFAYSSGAEQALTRASEDRWTVVSVRDDWATVFADAPGASMARGSGVG